jgi:hypothetical protein
MEKVTIAQHGICTLCVQFSKSTRLPAAKRPCGKKTVRSSIAHRTGPALTAIVPTPHFSAVTITIANLARK